MIPAYPNGSRVLFKPSGSDMQEMAVEAKRVKAFGTVCLPYPTVRISENKMVKSRSQNRVLEGAI